MNWQADVFPPSDNFIVWWNSSHSHLIIRGKFNKLFNSNESRLFKSPGVNEIYIKKLKFSSQIVGQENLLPPSKTAGIFQSKLEKQRDLKHY